LSVFNIASLRGGLEAAGDFSARLPADKTPCEGES
jgi:hypothetical protein